MRTKVPTYLQLTCFDVYCRGFAKMRVDEDGDRDGGGGGQFT